MSETKKGLAARLFATLRTVVNAVPPDIAIDLFIRYLEKNHPGLPELVRFRARQDGSGHIRLDAAKLIRQLKEKYPSLAGLSTVALDGDKISFEIGGQRITLGEVNSSNRADPDAPRPAPAASPKPPADAKEPTSASRAEEKRADKAKPKPEDDDPGPGLTEAQQEAFDDVITRARNLEL